MPDRPIFVVGFQRSGTTLVQAMLGAHPRIAAPPELYYLFRVADLADHYGDLADDDNLREVIDVAIADDGGRFDACGFDADALFELLRDRPRSYDVVLRVMLDDLARRNGKQRWSEKTPGQAAASVLALFPDAQIVHVVRDPRHVVASSLATPWTDGSARAIARRWRTFTLDNIRVGAEVGAGSFHQVRYEDLVRDPAAVLRPLCAFLGEDFDESMISGRSDGLTVAGNATPWQERALDTVTSPHAHWRERLGVLDRATVAAPVADVLGPLGYEQPRRSTVVVGRVVGAVTGLADARSMPADVRRRAAARTPHGRHDEVRRYLRERSADMGAR